MSRIIVAPSEVSGRFRQALLDNHSVISLVQITTSVFSQAQHLAELPVTGGSLNLASRADFRARGDITLPNEDGSLIPTGQGSLLAPLGNEMRVCRGIRFDGGDEELVELARLRIAGSSSVAETGEIRVSGFDRARIVQRARFEEAYEVASGAKATDAILDVVRGAIPDVVYDFIASDVALPALVEDAGGDRWAFAQGIATAIGCELYFDSRGVLVLRPVPVASGEPDWELVEGERGILVTAAEELSDEDTYNQIVVVGENPNLDGPIPRGVATDLDPSSPTYWEGDFGHVPYHATEYADLISTDDQAADAAAGILATKIGLTQQVNFGIVTNPALTESDLVKIRRGREAIDQLSVIDALNISLGGEEQSTGNTRAVQEVPSVS